MTVNMNDSFDNLRNVLSDLLVGASLKSFDWDSFFSVSFLSRNEPSLPPELRLTLCNNWSFHSLEKFVVAGQEALTPLDVNDCARGYVLAGIATKEVKFVEIIGGVVEIGFSGGVVMSIPLKNSDDPEEDSFILKTPEWVEQERQRYVEVGGEGEVSIS
jgi:hypothetical protein